MTGTIPPGEVVKNPTGTETTFVVLTVLGLVGLGSLIYVGTRKKTPTVIPGGNTGVIDGGSPPPNTGDAGGGGTLPPPVPPAITWVNALGPSGNYAYEPGGRYRISMPPQSGSSFVQQRNGIGQQNGFILVNAWDAGAALPADWPASDRDPTKWRFEFMTTIAENKVAPAGWAVWRAT